MTAFQTKTHRIVLIGPARRREFLSLVSELITLGHVCADFPTIEEALKQPEVFSTASLTVVLQSWSDQFAAKSVNSLIGLTLFSRLLCCYGSACESDGRNRSQWPEAVRVPVRLAASIVEQELKAVAAGQEAAPVTSARDEMITHRLGQSADWQPLTPLLNMNGAVISPDRVLRNTISLSLKDQGLSTLKLPLLTIGGREQIRHKETSRGPVHIVVHDLDPWSPLIEASLNNCRRMFPSAVILGLATMPDAGLSIEVSDQQLAAVVPKLDIQHGLRWHLKQLLKR